jgi:hypothetical protein
MFVFRNIETANHTPSKGDDANLRRSNHRFYQKSILTDAIMHHHLSHKLALRALTLQQ